MFRIPEGRYRATFRVSFRRLKVIGALSGLGFRVGFWVFGFGI